MTEPTPIIRVGDKVFILRRSGPGKVTSLLATVAKAGRVWLTLEVVPGSGRGGRFRRDTQQSEQSEHTFGYADRFVTAEQLAYEEKVAEARRVLREHGIELRRESRWYGPENVVALANLLRGAA